MDNPNEIDYDISSYTADLDTQTIEIIKMAERIKIFSKLRNLIYEKQENKDETAASVLGWAYERLAE
jgi:hypothetical protein